MGIIAYKAFYRGLVNKYGQSFVLHKVYQKNLKPLHFGELGHGFHMTNQLPDTFRFFNPIRDHQYCEVIGSGRIVAVENYMVDSSLMYVTEKMEITKVLSREDILRKVYEADLDELRRYLVLFPFTKEELMELKSYMLLKGEAYRNLLECTSYLQTGDVKTFQRDPRYLRKARL